MTAAQIAEAQRLASEWKLTPAKPMPSAHAALVVNPRPHIGMKVVPIGPELAAKMNLREGMASLLSRLSQIPQPMRPAFK